MEIIEYHHSKNFEISLVRYKIRIKLSTTSLHFWDIMQIIYSTNDPSIGKIDGVISAAKFESRNRKGDAGSGGNA